MYRLKSPLSAQLELTDACNNACLHCYNYWRYLDTGQRISSDSHQRTLEHFQKLLSYLIDNEVRTVTFTGGEPFLRRDILFDLVATATAAGVKAGINTNGALITGDDILRLQDVGVDFLLVSLLCDDPVIHDRIANAHSYTLTARAIANLVEAGLSASANMVVSTYNWSRVRQTAMYAKRLGLDEFSATPVLPCPLAVSHLDLVLTPEQVKTVLDDLLWVQEQGMMVNVLEPFAHCMFSHEERVRFVQFLSYRSCAAGISDMVISPDGDVRPCILATQIYGNLLTDGWEKCWGSLASWCSSDLLSRDCLDCIEVDECGGGCRVAALAKSGSINGKDPYMVQPLTDLVEILPENDELPEIHPETVVVFPPTALVRSEAFGCVLFRDRSFMFFDHDGAEFVQYLKARQTFTPSSVMTDIDIDWDVLINLLTILISRGFLIIQSGERRQAT